MSTNYNNHIFIKNINIVPKGDFKRSRYYDKNDGKQIY